MAEGNVSGPPLPTVKTNKPASEALLNEKVRRTDIWLAGEVLQLLWRERVKAWTFDALLPQVASKRATNGSLQRCRIFSMCC